MPIGLDPNLMPLPPTYVVGQVWQRTQDDMVTNKIRITTWLKWRQFQMKLYHKSAELISFPSQWAVLLPYEDLLDQTEISLYGMPPQFWMQPATFQIQGWEQVPDTPPLPQFDQRPDVLTRTWPKGDE